MDYCYYNGTIMPLSEARIPLTDRSVYFGDGVYDCMIGHSGGIYMGVPHVERLLENAERIFLSPPIDRPSLLNAIRKLIELCGYDAYTIYVQLSRFSERRSHYTENFSRSNLLITVTEHTGLGCEELKLLSYPDERYLMCNVKTLNLLPSVLAARYAESRGCDEAVFIRDGIVTECSHSNISILSSGKLITHPTDRFILPGITRRSLLSFASKMGLEVEERCFGYDEMMEADEVIVTSSTKLARRAAVIDGKALKMHDGEASRMLIDALKEDFVKNCC